MRLRKKKKKERKQRVTATADLLRPLAAAAAYRDMERLAVESNLLRQYSRQAVPQPSAGPLFSVEAWCDQNKLVRHRQPPRPIERRAPRFFGRKAFYIAEGTVNTIGSYVADLRNVYSVGGSSIVVSRSGEILDDESTLKNIEHFAIREKCMVWRGQNSALIATHPASEPNIPSGIIVCGAHCLNYFHWLVETLPRVLLARNLDLLGEAPLLIPQNLHPNLLRSLEIACDAKAKVQFVEPNHLYLVDHAIYVSDRTRILDNYDSAYWYKFQSIMDPSAIRDVQQSLISCADSTDTSRRKTMLLRGKKYRALLNEDKLATMACDAGFELLDPAELTFDQQVNYYRSCEVIIATSGAAVANIVFCRPGTRIFVLVSDFPHLDYYCFSQIADALALELVYVMGRREPRSSPYEHHEDFTIDESDFAEVLRY